MRQLLLVRHGQSEWNREERIQGQSGPGLTDVGRRQAACIAAWLADTVPGAEVVSSDLPRCVETARPVAEELGVGVSVDADLRERDLGDWTGCLVTEVRGAEPERFARWRDGHDVVPEVGGESSEELTGRVVPALASRLDAQGGEGAVVVVTHAGPVWHGTHGLLGLEPGILSGVENAAITEITAQRGERRLRVWNQTAHLPAELSPRRGGSGRRPARVEGR